MRIHWVRALGTITMFLAAGIYPLRAQQTKPPAPQLELSTPAFSDGGMIPPKYTCEGKPSAVSPELHWTNAPKETASFALIFHDSDAHPGKGMFDVTHWMLWNVPATVDQLPEGVPAKATLPDGMIQGKNVRGAVGYRGPCAPVGKPHHYTFELYALDRKLGLSPDATRAELLKAMDGHIIGAATYTGLFHR
jgi:Raf kinase inhibitor-like YbhB/YbcL family protein